MSDACTSESKAVFVYGTLKRGECRAARWPHPPLRVEPATTRGLLYDLGPYPALREGPGLVRGELWFIALAHLPRTLAVLDEIECYGVDDVDLYVRREVVCRTDAGAAFSAFTYFLADPSQLEQRQPIAATAAGWSQWSGTG